jgi:hypothetical protein
LGDRVGGDAGLVEEEIGSGRAGQDRVRGTRGHEHDGGWPREGCHATGELQALVLVRGDVDQHGGTKRGRDVLCALVAFEVRIDHESLGLEKCLARDPKGSVPVNDQHSDVLSRWPSPVLLVLHASSMRLSVRGRIGGVTGRIAGQAETPFAKP